MNMVVLLVEWSY